MKKMLACALALSAIHAEAAVLITSDFGYDGPKLSLAGYGKDYFYATNPVQLRSGITISSSDSVVVLGNGYMGLGNNGLITIPIIVPGLYYSRQEEKWLGFFDIDFANPLSKFAAHANYLVPFFEMVMLPPTITAFDSLGNQIASFNIAIENPISTPNGLNQFAFIGIDAGAPIISRMSFSGSALLLAPGNMSTGVVPEPASWAMLIAGFGLVGAAMRRRRAAVA